MQFDCNTLAEFPKVKITPTCWLWQDYLDSDGYGTIRLSNIRMKAHRLFYRAFIGDIPYGMMVCHTCDNPTCVNPAHLFLVTAKDNAEDSVEKRRQYMGDKHHLAKLTAVQAREIRELRGNGSTYESLAKRFGVTKSCIYSVCKGKTWKYIDSYAAT